MLIKTPYRVIAFNNKAKYNYVLNKAYNAGIELKGWEVSSLRNGKNFQITESYVKESSGELWICNSVISPELHCSSSMGKIDTQRARKLLLSRKEINQIIGIISKSGHTFIPIKVYWNNRMIKLTIFICTGKTNIDKRETIKQRELQRNLREYKKL